MRCGKTCACSHGTCGCWTRSRAARRRRCWCATRPSSSTSSSSSASSPPVRARALPLPNLQWTSHDGMVHRCPPPSDFNHSCNLEPSAAQNGQCVWGLSSLPQLNVLVAWRRLCDDHGLWGGPRRGLCAGAPPPPAGEMVLPLVSCNSWAVLPKDGKLPDVPQHAPTLSAVCPSHHRATRCTKTDQARLHVDIFTTWLCRTRRTGAPSTPRVAATALTRRALAITRLL